MKRLQKISTIIDLLKKRTIPEYMMSLAVIFSLLAFLLPPRANLIPFCNYKINGNDSSDTKGLKSSRTNNGRMRNTIKHLIIFKEIFIYAICLLVIAFFMYIFVRFVLLIPPSVGGIPKNIPDENDRYYSANKTFSVVIPEGWNASASDDLIQFDSFNKKSPVITHGAIIVIMKGGFDTDEIEKARRILVTLENKPDYDLPQVFGTNQVCLNQFQGMPALQIVGEKKPNWDSKYAYRYALYFIRDNHIFSVHYRTNKKMSVMPPESILNYFDTFKIEKH
jgi:hypothetical protein